MWHKTLGKCVLRHVLGGCDTFNAQLNQFSFKVMWSTLRFILTMLVLLHTQEKYVSIGKLEMFYEVAF